VRGRCLAAVALTALAAGCAASADPTANSSSSTASSTSAGPTIPAVPGIEAEAVRQRTDEAIGGQVQVRITATGDEPFTVTSVALDSPGFEPVAPRGTSTEFAPGRVIDLPVKYGEPRCDVAAEPATARLTVVRPGGRAEDVVAPLAAEIMTRIHDEECAVLALLEVVSVEVVGLADEEEAVTGQIRVARRDGDDVVSVERVGRSVLIEVEAPDLPTSLADDEVELSIPVVFTSASCEPHVLAETKKPYVFPFEVAVGDDERVVMDLPVDDDLRAHLVGLVDRVCLQG
jgi:hypothetical protein